MKKDMLDTVPKKNSYGNTNRSLYINEGENCQIIPQNGENLMTIICPNGGNMHFNRDESPVVFITTALPIGAVELMVIPGGSFSIEATAGKIIVSFASTFNVGV